MKPTTLLLLAGPKIEKVLTDTDRIIGSLEVREANENTVIKGN